MRCKNCDYPLWQIQDRRCPECGTGFRPSEFDFVLNSVRFCCPHCNQAYYGTGPRGHLMPSTFACVSCRQTVSMDDMILLPTEGVREEQTNVEVNPWLQRREQGLVRCWMSTALKALGTPNRLIEATPEGASTLSATLFALLTNGLYVCTGLILPIAVFMLIAVFGARGGAAGALGPIGSLGIMYLACVAAVMLGAFLWAAVAHGILLTTGPVTSGIGRTAQCMLYSSAAMVILAIPCIGFYFGFIGVIWWGVSATLMLKVGQRVETWRAVVAVVAPLVAIAAVGVALLFASIWYSTQQAAAAQQAAAQTQAAAAQAAANAPSAPANPLPNDQEATRIFQFAAGLRAHAQEQGDWPVHPAELLKPRAIWPGQFVSSRLDPRNPYMDNSAERRGTVRIGSMSIDQFVSSDEPTQDAAVRSAMTLIPENAVACRVGDTVFVYYGIDLATADPELWTVIGADEPGTNASSNRHIWVGKVDGSIDRLAAADFRAELAEQNALRAQAGLPPIPDPQTITADKPVVGED